MGKKNKKLNGTGLVSNKEQERLVEMFDEIFSGNASIDVLDKTEEQYVNDSTAEILAGIGIMIDADQGRPSNTTVNVPKEDVVSHRTMPVEDDDDTYLEGYNPDDDDPDDDPDDDFDDEAPPVINLIGYANSTNETSTSSLRILKNAYGVIFIGDNERLINIDTHELKEDDCSKYVSDIQISDLLTFVMINSRPDAVFTLDEYKAMIDEYSFICETYKFVIAKNHVFAYIITDDVWDSWTAIVDELKESNKLYDFCNTVAQKCSNKHYRMNHSAQYINFYIDVKNDEDDDAAVNANNIEYFKYILKKDEMNDAADLNTTTEVTEVDYWKFFSEYKDHYFALSSDSNDNADDHSTDVPDDNATIYEGPTTTVPSQFCKMTAVQANIEVIQSSADDLGKTTAPEEALNTAFDEVDGDDVDLNIEGSESVEEDSVIGMNAFPVHRRNS